MIFSVNDFTAKLTFAERKIIDNFFESLDLSNQDDPVVSLVAFGDLMSMIDTNNRYVYKGSVTTPPCDRFVYWNLMSTIYPISQKHLDLYKAQITRGENGNLPSYGNWRVTNPIDQHNVMRVADQKFGNDMMESNAANYQININIYNQQRSSSSCY
uniref:Alpha-carbonic anhydrase domain-containing protein n=1 Tax=Strombidium rassoulzadegani TaxID=1082188 RepID=A0A7S3CQV1_9SPIT|mmetsp:Transcript_4158/g.7040  ORF Transcript_4158/g.7040 Transcript_4158/m.7040 type:complete len:156 (+) Transcript_4158:478-945(+)